MARDVLKLNLVVAAGLLIMACGGYGSPLEVVRGNLAYSRGDFQGALVHYMIAAEGAPSDGWTWFNIGTVYYALGEHQAALEVWYDARRVVEEAGDANPNELSLIFATSYNRGVLLYQHGEYADAYEELRYALSVNSGSADAKVNLELALGKLQAAESANPGGEEPPGVSGDNAPVSTDDPGDAGPGEQTLRILEYVRRKETQQWFANREIESQDQPQDW